MEGSPVLQLQLVLRNFKNGKEALHATHEQTLRSLGRKQRLLRSVRDVSL